jgi:hypothetical protein
MAGAAFLIESTFRLTTGRTIRLPKNKNGNPAGKGGGHS